MAICQKCGGPIFADHKFCSNCGTPVTAIADASLPQSAQQPYGNTVSWQPYSAQQVSESAQEPTYSAYQLQPGTRPVQVVYDPNTGAGVQIYTPQAPQMPLPQFPAWPQQSAASVAPNQNSPAGRAVAEATPVEFALKATKVGVPVFFGYSYDPLWWESTRQAYENVYRAMGFEAQLNAQIASQINAYKTAYSEMMSVGSRPQPPQQLEPRPQPEYQTKPMAVPLPFSLPAYDPMWFTLAAGTAPAEMPQAVSEGTAERPAEAPAENEIPLKTAPQEQEDRAAEATAAEADRKQAEADRKAAVKEEKRNEQRKKREERKALRKISAFD